MVSEEQNDHETLICGVLWSFFAFWNTILILYVYLLKVIDAEKTRRLSSLHVAHFRQNMLQYRIDFS